MPTKSTSVVTLLIKSKELFIRNIKSAPVKKFNTKIKNNKKKDFITGLFFV